MSHARLTSAAAILLGLALAFIVIKLPANALALSSLMSGNPSLANLMMSDRLVRGAMGLAAFGLTFGLVFFLSSWAFVRQPLAAAARRLREAGTHGTNIPAATVADILSDIAPMRNQLAPLRRQFAVAHPDESAALPQPAGSFLSSSNLKNAVSPVWLSNIVSSGLFLFAILALVWGLATGANAQTLNQLDPNYGHAAGVLIGLQSGGVACLIALVGAFACYALCAAGRGLAGQSAEDFLSAVNAASYLPASRKSHQDESEAALDLSGAMPVADMPDLKPHFDTLVAAQSKLGSGMSELMSSIKSQTESVQSAVQNFSAALQDQEQRRDLKLADQRVAEAALMQETAMALQELKAALTTLKSAPAAQTLIPNTAVSQRLSSAMRSLRQATTDQPET
jgi:hypothetical protein